MKIIRKINGETIELELTEQEMLEAYTEYTDRDDEEAVTNYLHRYIEEAHEELTFEQVEQYLPDVIEEYKNTLPDCRKNGDWMDYAQAAIYNTLVNNGIVDY